jgi:DNA-binding LytR/AlgR family response regulator
VKKQYNIEIIIDEKYSETKITIHTNTKTKEIDNIVEAIKNITEYEIPYISAYSNNKLELVNKDAIFRIGRIGRQVVLETENSSYIVKKTLSQLEEELDSQKFIRISQSEIINAYKVKSLDVSIAGTIRIEFNNGMKSNVSRRYVKLVKNFFKK